MLHDGCHTFNLKGRHASTHLEITRRATLATPAPVDWLRSSVGCNRQDQMDKDNAQNQNEIYVTASV